MLIYIIIVSILSFGIYYFMYKREQQKWDEFMINLKNKYGEYPEIDQ